MGNLPTDGGQLLGCLWFAVYDMICGLFMYIHDERESGVAFWFFLNKKTNNYILLVRFTK